MKKIIISIFIIALGSVCTLAQNRSINFEQGDFDKVLEKARAMNRNVFMDCYTSWCGPCKQMAREVFTIDSIADYFNATFVCVKYDMEKEGKVLRDRYKLAAYPTFFVLDGNGEVLHQLTGYYSPENFMKAIRLAKPEYTMDKLEAKFKAGDRTPEFIEAYLFALKGSGQYEKIDTVLKSVALYQSEEDISSRPRWRVFEAFHNFKDSPDGQYFLAHLKTFRDAVGDVAVDRMLDRFYSMEVTDYVFWEPKFPGKKFDIGLLDKVIDEVQSLEFDKQSLTLAFAYTEKMYRQKNVEAALQYIRTARELRIMNQEYQLRYFSIYIDKLIDLAADVQALKALKEECGQMIGLHEGNIFLFRNYYKICSRLNDKDGQDKMRTLLEAYATQNGQQVILGADGTVEFKKNK